MPYDLNFAIDKLGVPEGVQYKGNFFLLCMQNLDIVSLLKNITPLLWVRRI